MLRSKVDRRRIPGTLFIGQLIVAACGFFLFCDVIRSRPGPVQTDAQILQLPRQGTILRLGLRFRIRSSEQLVPTSWLSPPFQTARMAGRAPARHVDGVMSVFTRMFNRVDTYDRLAQSYAAAGEPPGARWDNQCVEFGGCMQYDWCVALIAAAGGLYVPGR